MGSTKKVDCIEKEVFVTVINHTFRFYRLNMRQNDLHDLSFAFVLTKHRTLSNNLLFYDYVTIRQSDATKRNLFYFDSVTFCRVK